MLDKIVTLLNSPLVFTTPDDSTQKMVIAWVLDLMVCVGTILDSLTTH